VADWSSWAAPIIAALSGAVAGGAIANWSATRSSHRVEATVKRRALVALYDECFYIWQAVNQRAWGHVAPFPTDAFEGAKGYLAELPQSITDAVYRAERAIARFNAFVELKVSSGNISDTALDQALIEVENEVGTAYGYLEQHLSLGVHKPSKN
jgi:hypothetical protein